MERFPRTRGDGPPAACFTHDMPLVPPHPRGWSLSDRRAARPVLGSPAPAGMVPDELGLQADACRFPRTRGDGPDNKLPAFATGGVPPHPRGWSPQRLKQPSIASGSPAPAGMVPAAQGFGWPCGGFPRTRGDGPATSSALTQARSVPPHPRGWSPIRTIGPAVRAGSPAPAGMVPHASPPKRHRCRFPRTRGDGPCICRSAAMSLVVPPHPRGWSQTEQEIAGAGFGSPAPAGMVPIRKLETLYAHGFPRTRGDGPIISCFSLMGNAVPPHPRGWSHPERDRADVDRGSPAPAGMVPGCTRPWATCGGFPRTRGDGPEVNGQTLKPTKVPPHPRGWSLPH